MGMAQDRPSTVVASESFDTSTITRWRSVMRAQVVAIARQGELVVRTAFNVFVQGAWQAAPRNCAQIGDRVDDGHCASRAGLCLRHDLALAA